MKPDTHGLTDILSAAGGTEMTRTDYPADVAAVVSLRRPDLAANDAISAVLTHDPSLTADQVIEILDEAAREWAEEQAHEQTSGEVVARRE